MCRPVMHRLGLEPSFINFSRVKAPQRPSGGLQNSFTFAVAHRDSTAAAVLDAVREVRPPFSPEAVVAEFAATLRSYRVTKVSGDRYAGEWPREQFRNVFARSLRYAGRS